MPTFDEIYQKHSKEYDDLVSHEDYLGNFSSVLNTLFDFTHKTIIELGTGTGRVTQCYIDKAKRAFCLDQSQHMLSKAQQNLKKYRQKLTFALCDNLAIQKIKEKVDFVIEGWSFGHAVSNEPDRLVPITQYLIDHAGRLLLPHGKIIIIETLGTHVEKPAPPSDALMKFYQLLEKTYAFKKEVVSTDYRFQSVEDAAQIMGFFFGDEMRKNILQKNNCLIKEFTGIWHRSI